MSENRKHPTTSHQTPESSVSKFQENKDRLNQIVEDHLTGKSKETEEKGMIRRLGNAMQSAWNYLEVSYHDYVWSYDDWMNDLNQRIESWREEIQNWEEGQMELLETRLKEFMDKASIQYDKRKNENDATRFQSLKHELHNEISDFYEEMMSESERVLVEWIDTAYERFEHVKQQLTEKDRKSLEEKYQILKNDALDFAAASNQRADDFYDQCMQYLERLGLSFEKDQKIDEMKKKGNELIEKHRNIWSKKVEEIKSGLIEEKFKEIEKE